MTGEVIAGIYLGIGFLCAVIMVNENKDKPDSVLLTICFFWTVLWPLGLLAVGIGALME